MMQSRKPATRSAEALGARLFRFAAVADTHVNQEDGKTSSPYRTNALANDRARFVFQHINRLDPAPEFVIHLGDVVHPIPELPSHRVAADRFKSIAADLKVPLHVLPGNHDVGDKPVEWMPAGSVRAEHVDTYRKLYGADYYAFEARSCVFLLLNAQLVNSGLAYERDQKSWLEEQLAAARGRRVFLFTHYPPYVTDRDEPGSYDNLDEPGRSWLLGLVERYSIEALFAGHVHNFWYDVIGGTEMYLLPATSFMRHDYSEFYRIAPGAENGRDDPGKYGYFVVDVHEHGHVAHCVRTYGSLLAAGCSLPAARKKLDPVHTRTSRMAPVGVDLRHPWSELIEVAATGGVQEFERKRARNDYPLLALWEMGVRKLRVPTGDVLDPRVRARMRILRESGHEFIIAGFDLPSRDLVRALEAEAGLVHALEVVLPGAAMRSALEPLAAVRAATGVPIYLSKLRRIEDARFDGERFNHFINHGFVAAERAQIEELLSKGPVPGAVDGLVFRIPRREQPWDALGPLRSFCASLSVRPVAHIRLAGESPADVMNDDHANALRVAEAVFAAFANPGMECIVDTFMDVDRGYFPRNGFIDRRFDPRLASRAFAHLHSALGAEPIEPAGTLSGDGLRVVFANQGPDGLALLMPSKATALDSLKLEEAQAIRRGGSVCLADLATGELRLVVARHEAEDTRSLAFQSPLAVEAPLLLRWEGTVGAPKTPDAVRSFMGELQ